jgi:hypothetical protein
MGSLIGKLAALLGDEYKLLTGVRKQIEFLERELSSSTTSWRAWRRSSTAWPRTGEAKCATSATT